MRRGVAAVVLCLGGSVPLAGCSALSGSGSATASPPVVTQAAAEVFAAAPTSTPSGSATGAPSGSATAVPAGSPSVASPSVSPSVSPSASPSATPSGNPKNLLAQARAAFLAAGSVHLTGTLTGNGKPAPLDIRVKGDAGGTGWVTFPQGRISVVRVGRSLWTTADTTTWTKLTKDAGTAAGLTGKYVKVTGTQNVADFTKLTTASALATDLLTPAGALTIGPPATVRGVPAIALRDGGNGGTFYLAGAVPHLPLAIDAPGTKLQFSDYGKAVTLTAPAAAKVTSLNGF